MDKLIDLISQIIDQGSVSINLYMSFIIELMKNQKFQDFEFDFAKNFEKEIVSVFSNLEMSQRMETQWHHQKFSLPNY